MSQDQQAIRERRRVAAAFTRAGQDLVHVDVHLARLQWAHNDSRRHGGVSVAWIRLQAAGAIRGLAVLLEACDRAEGVRDR